MAAYTTIDDPEAHFQVKTYSGNSTDDTAITLDGTNNLQPDMVWFKSRSAAINHVLVDSVRGVTKYLTSNDTSGEATVSDALKSFDSDGFTLDEDATTSSAFVNGTGKTYVTWCWKAGGSGSANEDGSVNTTATSVNSTSKFSIGIYTGTGSAGMTVGHGLGVAPDFIVVKKRGAADRWCAYNSANTSAPETEAIYLSETDATADDADFWNDVAPSSSLVTFGDKGDINATVTTVMYCWSAVQGFSKFGSYEGNNNADGTFVYTGFRPALVVVKAIDTTGPWLVVDNKRIESGSNFDNAVIFWNETTAEQTTNENYSLDLLSNGFKLRSADDWSNDPETYIYAAFAEAPFVNSNGVPCNAR